jgi:hypothetical protein
LRIGLGGCSFLGGAAGKEDGTTEEFDGVSHGSI